MARKRTSMKKIREIIRYYAIGLSERQIARCIGVSRPVVSENIKKFKDSGLEIKDIQSMDDDSLLEIVGNVSKSLNTRYAKLKRLFPKFAKELKRVGVTLTLLWEEYRMENPDGYSHTQFCYHFSKWKDEQKLSMHIEHKAGDKMFTDFTGKHMYITDRITGEHKEVEVFVAVLGASQYTYVEAVGSQKKEDWIRVNENALIYFGGVTSAIVPDNLKSAVYKACKYEPDINPEFQKFAEHYDTVVYPARPYKPKDKALVENAVRIVYSRIFAPLRDYTFYSLKELNDTIRELLEQHNNKTMSGYKASRRELFEELDKPALKPLPSVCYEMKECQTGSVHFHYHVHLKEDDHYYSVPYRYRGKKIEIWYSKNTVEIYYKHRRIALHCREINSKKKYTTLPEHMPPEHKWFNDWNPDKFINWAGNIGPNVKKIIKEVLSRAKYPEQSYKTCMGIINLHRKYKPNGKQRLDKACRRAMEYGAFSFKSVNNILKNNLENIEQGDFFDAVLPEHENIRGQDYYFNKENT